MVGKAGARWPSSFSTWHWTSWSKGSLSLSGQYMVLCNKLNSKHWRLRFHRQEFSDASFLLISSIYSIYICFTNNKFFCHLIVCRYNYETVIYWETNKRKLFILSQMQHEICRNGHRMSCKQLDTNVYFLNEQAWDCQFHLLAKSSWLAVLAMFGHTY